MICKDDHEAWATPLSGSPDPLRLQVVEYHHLALFDISCKAKWRVHIKVRMDVLMTIMRLFVLFLRLVVSHPGAGFLTVCLPSWHMAWNVFQEGAVYFFCVLGYVHVNRYIHVNTFVRTVPQNIHYTKASSCNVRINFH
jgi:hypothetical protein